jgi:hypothetical protein
LARYNAAFLARAQNFKFTYLQQPLNRYTFKAPKVRAWVEQYCKGLVVLNLFAGPTRLAGCIEFSNDLDPSFATTFHLDALDCVNLLRCNRERKFDRIVIDPPYSYRKSMALYHGNKNSRFKKVLDLIPEILTPKGLVITFGYHSNVMSKKRGFAIREILLISHGGAQHDTIVSVEERIKVTEKEIIT